MKQNLKRRLVGPSDEVRVAKMVDKLLNQRLERLRQQSEIDTQI